MLIQLLSLIDSLFSRVYFKRILAYGLYCVDINNVVWLNNSYKTVIYFQTHFFDDRTLNIDHTLGIEYTKY